MNKEEAFRDWLGGQDCMCSREIRWLAFEAAWYIQQAKLNEAIEVIKCSANIGTRWIEDDIEYYVTEIQAIERSRNFLNKPEIKEMLE